MYYLLSAQLLHSAQQLRYQKLYWNLATFIKGESKMKEKLVAHVGVFIASILGYFNQCVPGMK